MDDRLLVLLLALLGLILVASGVILVVLLTSGGDAVTSLRPATTAASETTPASETTTAPETTTAFATTAAGSTTSTTITPASTSVAPAKTTGQAQGLRVNVTAKAFYRKDEVSLGIYDGDDVVVSVTDSAGVKLSGAGVFLDGKPAGYTGASGSLEIPAVSAGEHKLTAVKDALEAPPLDFSVWKSAYGMSSFVRRKLDDSTRRDFISDGMVNVRFYDLPSCAICRVMRPKVSAIVSPNRDCVVYEIISLWKYNTELAGKFTGLSTPIIEVEGPRKSFQTSGMVSSEKMRDLIESASSGCVLE